VFNDQGQILLANEHRHEVDEMVLRIPGANVNKDEAPEATAIRECQEELGFKPQKVQLYNIQYMGYKEERKPFNYAFICSDLVPSKLDGDKGEKIEVVPMSLEAVADLIWDGKICNDWKGLIFLRIKRDLENGKIKL
jgi:ADP-ribose pyrophosphatase